MKKRYSNFIPLIFIILFVFVVLYISYEKDCAYDQSCFDLAFESCDRATYFSDEGGSLFQYTIKGSARSGCEVEVSVIQVSQEADQDTKDLFPGKSMTCYIPENQEFTVDTLTLCTGPLKEAMYELIIQKMYSILAQNLGDLIYQLQE
tara:strand:+ start:862 stop:1305 length:444 start_codon:yes stop_codon:yes gene_type:complete